ncbi:threonine aldolase family protein [Myxococcota bacterium]|nr:threonine aldolase family protein [Myxococcota bacterium]MBU1383132.1 threonine aldolase family protein [Myxococcota bacterium]MBU1498067.1 threonine aldolase family protein [Myxococcota bacterium]
MTQEIINLYSDTQTLPSAEMRNFMASAAVGDEQQRADPTVNALCEKVASLLGKEAAMFLPSGAMCNHIAIKTHTRPGDELIMDTTAHVRNFESNSYAVVSGVGVTAIEGDRGVFTAQDVRHAVREKDNHMGVSSLLIVEQTTNLGAGRIWSLDQIRDVTTEARNHGLACHMDGARLLNASVKSGISAAAYSGHFDSVWIDFSKGLGAPVGAALAGSRDFIEKAWRYKHMLGGAMRQAGIIAAGALYALEHNVERLALDHANAALLGQLISDIPGINVWPVETNMVYFDVSGLHVSNKQFAEKLFEMGLKTSVTGRKEVRMVTHLDISEEMIRNAADIIRKTSRYFQ